MGRWVNKQPRQDGIRKDFNLADDNTILLEADCSNYVSTTDLSVKHSVEKQIIIEIDNGNYVITDTYPTFIKAIKALGAIPKPNINYFGLIQGCSRPI